MHPFRDGTSQRRGGAGYYEEWEKLRGVLAFVNGLALQSRVLVFGVQVVNFVRAVMSELFR